MLADITHFTVYEGGDWIEWPFKARIKPSNPELLTSKPDKHWDFIRKNEGAFLRLNSLKLSDGSEWDSWNGFRDGGGAR